MVPTYKYLPTQFNKNYTEGTPEYDQKHQAALALTVSLDAAITSAKVGSSFDLTICNDNNSGASSTVPVTTGTGITVFGSVTIARHGANTYRIVKTGDAAYSAFLK